METTEYRCALVRPRSTVVLALGDAGRYRLPRVQVRHATRPAQEVQRAARQSWGLQIFVLEAAGPGAFALAELLTPAMTSPLREVPIEQLAAGEILEGERHRLNRLLAVGAEGRTHRPGWIDEAIAWMEAATGCTFRSGRNIEQWNAGGGFALFRARSDNGRHYWLKATGEPNMQEFPITRFLSQLCPEFLPELVATRKEWNAWLTEEAGEPISDLPTAKELIGAAGAMAELQLLTIGHTEDLLAAGAFDQRLPVLRSQIDIVVAYLIEAMSRQTSTKATPLKPDRLLELGEILREACDLLEWLQIPDTLIHNDLNVGNILSDGRKYVFTDWSEAGVGNPLLSCERLCQLNRAHADSIWTAYRNPWSHRMTAKTIDRAMALAPILAIYTCLYGRGDWLRHGNRVRPQFESYARSLARHMDRVARDPSLLEALCR